MRVARASRGRSRRGAVRERLIQCEWSAFTGERDDGVDGLLGVGWCRDALIELMAREYIGAVALGPVVVGDAMVVTLVVVDDDLVEARAQAGVAPALDRITLRERLEQGGRMAVSPVREVAFVGVWGRTDLTGLTRLGGYGETLLIVPPATVPDPVELAECDWRGVGVLQTTEPMTEPMTGHTRSQDGARPAREESQVCSEDLVPARWLVMPGVRPRPWATSMRYEQLLELAMRAPTRLRPEVPSAVLSEPMTEDAAEDVAGSMSAGSPAGSSEAVGGSGSPDVSGDVASLCDQSVG